MKKSYNLYRDIYTGVYHRVHRAFRQKCSARGFGPNNRVRTSFCFFLLPFFFLFLLFTFPSWMRMNPPPLSEPPSKHINKHDAHQRANLNTLPPLPLPFFFYSITLVQKSGRPLLRHPQPKFKKSQRRERRETRIPRPLVRRGVLREHAA